MTRDDIIRMAREAEGDLDDGVWLFMPDELERFAALVAAAEREKVAQWMIQRSYATGHGDTTEDLLQELDWQIADGWNRALMNGVKTEREECAKVCEQLAEVEIMPGFTASTRTDQFECAAAIRARGQA